MKTPWMPRLGVITTVLVLSATMAQAVGTQLLVSNVQAQQRPFTAIWDVTYDLETVGDIAVEVKMFLSTDSGATYPDICTEETGVLPGIGNHIIWYAGIYYPGLNSSTCRLRVTADDWQADFVTIPSDTFMMGSPTSELGRDTDETQHQVTLTHGLYAQTTEVTNQQYRDMAQWAYDNGYVTAANSGMYGSSLRDNLDGSNQVLKFLGLGDYGVRFENGVFGCVNPTKPVKYVTWYGAAAYCDWLSLQQGLPRAYDHSTWQCNAGSPYTATGYRLPTEAEWEYTCRAGTQTPFNTGSCLDSMAEANYYGPAPYTGCPAGLTIGVDVTVKYFPANAFGLYDLHGNLWEWCNDWYGAYDGTVTDPAGVTAASSRVIRGGYYRSAAQYCRSAFRNYSNPTSWNEGLGFRPVRSTN